MDTGLDPVMVRIRELQKEKQMDLAKLGKSLGYSGDARRSVQQFLSCCTDPKVSMVRKIAQAFKIPVSQLFE